MTPHDHDHDVVDAELLDDPDTDHTPSNAPDAAAASEETSWNSASSADPMERSCAGNAHLGDDRTSETCATCGRPRCTARSKRSGRRCQRDPVVGGRVCASHGGGAPQTVRAIERRRVDAEAQVLVDRVLWRTDAVPIADSASALMLMAGRFEQAVSVLAGGVESTRVDGGLPDPVAMLAWTRVLEQQRKLLTDMERLGIAQRGVELEADKVRLVEAGIYAVLDFLGVVGEQRERALAILFAAMQVAAQDRGVGDG